MVYRGRWLSFTASGRNTCFSLCVYNGFFSVCFLVMVVKVLNYILCLNSCAEKAYAVGLYLRFEKMTVFKCLPFDVRSHFRSVVWCEFQILFAFSHDCEKYLTTLCLDSCA